MPQHRFVKPFWDEIVAKMTCTSFCWTFEESVDPHQCLFFFPPTSHPATHFYSVVIKVPNLFGFFSSLKGEWIALTVLVSARFWGFQPL